MRLSRRLLLPLMLLLACPAAARGFDGGGWTVQPGEWYSEVFASRQYASRFFLADGEEVGLAGRFQEHTLRSRNEIGWLKPVSLLLDIPFTSQTIRTGNESETVSGLSDLRLGLRVRLRGDAPGIVLDAGWQAPLGYDKNVFPRLGDGRQKGYVDLNAGLHLPGFPAFVQASRGFLFVSEDGVLVTRTSADLAGWLTSNLLLGARYFDVVAWNTADTDFDGSRYAAGPVLVLRMDDHIDLSIGAFRDFAGRSTRESTEFYVALGMKQTKLGPYQGFLGTRPSR